VLLPPNTSQQKRCQCWRISATYILWHATKTRTGLKLKLVHSEILSFQTFLQLAAVAGTEATPNLKKHWLYFATSIWESHFQIYLLLTLLIILYLIKIMQFNRYEMTVTMLRLDCPSITKGNLQEFEKKNICHRILRFTLTFFNTYLRHNQFNLYQGSTNVDGMYNTLQLPAMNF
jgi:hypothetical protein